jgi:hypothetical protein
MERWLYDHPYIEIALCVAWALVVLGVIIRLFP